MANCPTINQALWMLALAAALSGCGRPPPPPAPRPTDGAVPTQPGAGQGFRLVVEAETGALVPPFAVVTEDGTSGGQCVRLPVLPKDEKTGVWTDPAAGDGKVTLSVVVPTAGKVWLWFRTHWRGGCSNSFQLTYPDGRRTVGEDGTYGACHWVKGPVAITLAAGTQTFTIGVREDDLGIDQMILTTDPEFIPQGVETPPGT